MIWKNYMGKRIMSIIVSIAVIISMVPELQINAATSNYDDFNYSINDDGKTITILGYTGDETDIVIPDTINGKSVTSIGASAFSYCTNISGIHLPESIKSIGEDAFFWCSKLSSVNLPEGLTSIPNGMFDGCHELTGITLPESLTSIGARAFRSTGLTEISIPEGVTSIGGGAFRLCPLTSITLPNGLTKISGSMFRESGIASITIPEGVNTIEGYAFMDCNYLTDISIPEGVTSIEDSAFSYCNRLTGISIPESVTSIGKDIFSGVDKNIFIIHCKQGGNIEAYAKQNGFKYSYGSFVQDAPVIDNTGTVKTKDFSLESLLSFTVPESVPLIGGEEVEIDFSNIPVVFSRKGNTYRLGIGVNNLGDEEDSDDKEDASDKVDNDNKEDTSDKVDNDNKENTSDEEGTDNKEDATDNKDNDNKEDNDSKDDDANKGNSSENSKDEGWNQLKKYVETRKKEVLQGKQILSEAKGSGLVGFGSEKGISIECCGYAEGTIDSKGIHSCEGQLNINITGKVGKQWQTIVVCVPVVLKLAGEIGVDATGKVGLDFDNSKVNYGGELDITLPQIYASAGIGLAYTFDVSVYGSASNNIYLSSQDKSIKASLTGEMGVSASILNLSYSKSIINGKYNYYDSREETKSSDNFTTMSKFSITDIGELDVKPDDTAITQWNASEIKEVNNLNSENQSVVLQNNIYGGSKAKMVKTKNGKYILSYIGVTDNRTKGNQYAAMYSVYNNSTHTWSTPVVIHDNLTADYEIDSVVNGNEVYFIWTDMNRQVDSKTVEELDVNKEAAYSEIEIAKLDTLTNKLYNNSLTQNATADIAPVIHSGNGIYIAWIENSNNDVLNMSGDNIIHFGKITDMNYREINKIIVKNPISKLAVGDLDDCVHVSYVENAQNKKIMLFNEETSDILVDSTNGEVSDISFGSIDDEDRLLWIEHNSGEGYINSSDGQNKNNLINHLKIGNDFCLVNEYDRDLIYTESLADDSSKDMEIVAYEINDGIANEPVSLLGLDGSLSNLSVSGDQDGYKVLYTNSFADFTDDGLECSYNLCFSTISKEDSVMLNEVSYNPEEIKADNKASIYVKVKNNGLMDTDSSSKVGVYYKNQLIGSSRINNLTPGKDKEVKVSITLPEEIDKNSSMNVVVLKNDVVQSTYSCEVGKTDLSIEAEQNNNDAVIKIKNETAYDTNAVLKLYDQNQEGRLLETVDIGLVEGNQTVNRAVNVSDYVDNNVNSIMFVVSTKDEEVYKNNNIVSLYVGKDILKTPVSIDVNLIKDTFVRGETLSTNDIQVSVNYTDNSSKPVSNYSTNINSIDMNIPGIKELVVTYEEVGLICSKSVLFTVKTNSTFEDGTTIEKTDNNINNAPVHTLEIVPKTTNKNIIVRTIKVGNIKGLKAIAAKKSLKLSWKKVKKASGYEIQYSLKSNYKKHKKIIIKKNAIVSKKIKGLKQKKKYYIRIRSYIKDKKKKVYGKWTKISKVTK